MNRITCPHCGFLNFSISAYCGRCEQPLKPAEAAPAPAIRPHASTPVMTPAPVRPTVTPTAPSAAPMHAPAPRPAAAVLELDVTPVEPTRLPPPVTPLTAASDLQGPDHGTMTPMTSPHATPAVVTPPVAAALLTPVPVAPPQVTSAPSRPAPKAPAMAPVVLPLASVPPPALPEVAELSPAPLPIELPRGTKGPELEVEVSAAVATGLRLWGARAVDLVLALVAGMLTAFFFGLADAVVLSTRGVWLADYVAEWVNLHPRAAFAGVVAAVGFNLVHELLGGLIAGRTLGRWLTRTTLVGADGRRVRWLPVFLRSLGSVLSSLPLGMGHYWSMIDPMHRTWHDRLAKTLVVVELRS